MLSKANKQAIKPIAKQISYSAFELRDVNGMKENIYYKIKRSWNSFKTG